MRLRGSLRELEERNKVLLRENQELEKEIYLLRNSPAFQEKVAREEKLELESPKKLHCLDLSELVFK